MYKQKNIELSQICQGKIMLSKEEEQLIDKMHEYLSIFRKLAKYTSEELGNKIGVSRPTMVNFERDVKNIRMSKAQFIALKTVLLARAEELIKQDKDDSLDKAIKLVFYTPNYEENKKTIKETLTTAGAVCGVAGSISTMTILTPILPLLGGVALASGIASFILKGLNGKDDN